MPFTLKYLRNSQHSPPPLFWGFPIVPSAAVPFGNIRFISGTPRFPNLDEFPEREKYEHPLTPLPPALALGNYVQICHEIAHLLKRKKLQKFFDQ